MIYRTADNWENSTNAPHYTKKDGNEVSVCGELGSDITSTISGKEYIKYKLGWQIWTKTSSSPIFSDVDEGDGKYYIYNFSIPSK